MSEKEFIMDEEEYIRERFKDQLDYYDQKAIKYQKRWVFGSVMLVILTPIPMAVLGFIDTPLWARLVIITVSYASTIITSLLSLLKYRELWIAYRSTHEELLREFFHYKTATKVYSEIEDPKERFKLFVERVEEIMAQERSKWLDLIQQQDITTYKKS